MMKIDEKEAERLIDDIKTDIDTVNLFLGNFISIFS